MPQKEVDIVHPVEAESSTSQNGNSSNNHVLCHGSFLAKQVGGESLNKEQYQGTCKGQW